jgi:hypothetical protein
MVEGTNNNFLYSGMTGAGYNKSASRQGWRNRMVLLL